LQDTVCQPIAQKKVSTSALKSPTPYTG